MIRRKKNPGMYTTPKAAKHDRRWTLVFIGSQGKTHTFYRLREALLIGAALCLVAGSLLGVLVYSNWRSASRSENLRLQIDNLQEAVDTLRNEKEILMARLVVAESRVEENFTSPAKRPSKPKAGANTPKKTAPEENRQEKSNTQTEKVGADDVQILHDPNAATLKVNYKVLNQGPEGQRISGRSVVILKPDSDKQTNWVVLPPGPLLNGKPTGEYGKAFSIFNWRTMRFQARYKKDPYLFKTVMIYVYSMSGDLMLEKQLPVGTKAKIVQVARRSEPSRAKPNTPQEPEKPQATKKETASSPGRNGGAERPVSSASSQTPVEVDTGRMDDSSPPREAAKASPPQQPDAARQTTKQPGSSDRPSPRWDRQGRDEVPSDSNSEPVPGIDY